MVAAGVITSTDAYNALYRRRASGAQQTDRDTRRRHHRRIPRGIRCHRRDRRMNTPHRVIEGTAILDRLHATLTRYVVLPSRRRSTPSCCGSPPATHNRRGRTRPASSSGHRRSGAASPGCSTSLKAPAASRSSPSTRPPPPSTGQSAATTRPPSSSTKRTPSSEARTPRPTKTSAACSTPVTSATGPRSVGQRPQPSREDRHVRDGRARRDRANARHHRGPCRSGPDASPRTGREGRPVPAAPRRPGIAATRRTTSTEWLRSNILAALERATPVMPLEDRAADTWEPLIAVADLAGGDWPERGRHAAEVMTAERDGNTVNSDRIRLLTDCRAAFGPHDAIPTTVLLDRLKADPEAPWAEYGNNRTHPDEARRATPRVRHQLRQHPVHDRDKPRATSAPTSSTPGNATAPKPTPAGSRPSRPSRPRPAHPRDGT